MDGEGQVLAETAGTWALTNGIQGSLVLSLVGPPQTLFLEPRLFGDMVR